MESKTRISFAQSEKAGQSKNVGENTSENVSPPLNYSYVSVITDKIENLKIDHVKDLTIQITISQQSK